MPDIIFLGFPGVTVVKNLPANAGNIRVAGSIPRSGRSPGIGNGNQLQLLAWKIPRTEKSGRLQSMGLQRDGHDRATERARAHTHTHTHTHMISLKVASKHGYKSFLKF